MKVEIEKTNTKPKSKYPYLGIYKENVVWFSSENWGTRLAGPDGAPVNAIPEDFDECVFEPFTGTVKLSND